MQLEGKFPPLKLVPTPPARVIIALSQLDGRKLEAAELPINGYPTGEAAMKKEGVEQYVTPESDDPHACKLNEGVSVMFPSAPGRAGLERVQAPALLTEE